MRGLAVALALAAAVAHAEPAPAPVRIAPPEPLPPRLLRTLAHNPRGYQPGQPHVASDLLLGDLLFHSPRTLGPRAQALGLSCHSCHPNGATNRAFLLAGLSDRPGNIDLTTAHFRPGADDGRANPVNIPSLRGVRYTAPYGRDGRVASLAEFTQGVIAGEFGGAVLSPSQLAALVRYEQELDFLPNALLDTHGDVSATAGEAARRGERLFRAPRAGLGGASCATCHPSTSYFRDGRVHRLGAGERASPYGLDDGHETPTLLGTAESAPYFHDGRFATLADVVAWFEREYQLGLRPEERADLTAYLEVVGAADARVDARSLGQRLAETFVYLSLLVAGEVRDERAVWSAAVELVIADLASLGDGVPGLAARRRALQAALEALARRVADGAPLLPLRAEVNRLHEALLRLAADWTGALSSP